MNGTIIAITMLMLTITAAPNPALPAATPLVATGTPASSGSSLGSLSFGDVVDAINPLQHIPVVSSVYRAATGSDISPVSEIAGDALYGALSGSAALSIASSVGDVAIKQITGASLSQNVINIASGMASYHGGTPAVSALVADSPGVSQAIVASQANANAKPGAASAIANASSPSAFFKSLQADASAAQYQRAQTLDTGNKLLLKMAV